MNFTRKNQEGRLLTRMNNSKMIGLIANILLILNIFFPNTSAFLNPNYAYKSSELSKMSTPCLRDIARHKRDLLRNSHNAFPKIYEKIKDDYYQAYDYFQKNKDKEARKLFIEAIKASDAYLDNLPIKAEFEEQKHNRNNAAELMVDIKNFWTNEYFPGHYQRGKTLFDEIEKAFEYANNAMENGNFKDVIRGDRSKYIRERLVKLELEIMPAARCANSANRLEKALKTLNLSIDYWRARGLREKEPKEFWRRHETFLRLRDSFERIKDRGLSPEDHAEIQNIHDMVLALSAELDKKGKACFSQI